MIEFLDVTKIYQNDIVALDRINLRIDNGEFVFLIGPSGAGKSTLIKLILREEDVTEGEVYFNETEISALGARRIPNLRRRFGVVFQDFRLLEDRDVFSNVAYALEIHGEPRKVIQNKVVESLTRVGLLDKRKCFPHQLSGGEQQRISIARALINEPDVLIADEPTGNLDGATAQDVMKLLEDINEAGTTIIMATHAKEIVNTMKRRVIELDHGRLVRDEEEGLYEGEPNVFYNNEIEKQIGESSLTNDVEEDQFDKDLEENPQEIAAEKEASYVKSQDAEEMSEEIQHTDVISSASSLKTSSMFLDDENTSPNADSTIEEFPKGFYTEEELIMTEDLSHEEITEKVTNDEEFLEPLKNTSERKGVSTTNEKTQPDRRTEEIVHDEDLDEDMSEEELSPYELGKRYMQRLNQDEFLMTGALPGEEDDDARY